MSEHEEKAPLGQRLWQGLIVLAFLATVLLPPAVGLTGLDPSPRLVEKRQKASAPAPPASWQDLETFPERFDAYYRDHFGLRDLLIRGHHWTWRKVFRVSPVPKAVLGGEGWLYLGPPATDYQAMRPLQVEQLEAWRRALEGYRSRLEEKGVAFVFAVAPNKHTIYPEYLPPSTRPLWRRSPLDQLLDYLARHSELHLVDLRPSILAAKAEGRQVYFRNDTHWTPEGDYAAYRGLIEGIGRRFEGFEPLPREAFAASDGLRNGGDLSRLMGIAFAPERYTELALRTPRAAPRTPIPKGRRQFAAGRWRDVWENPEREVTAIVLIDSFGLQLEPHVAEHFGRTVFSPGVLLPDELLEREKPDMVILEMVERYMADPRQLAKLERGRIPFQPRVFGDGFEDGDLAPWGANSPEPGPLSR